MYLKPINETSNTPGFRNRADVAKKSVIILKDKENGKKALLLYCTRGALLQGSSTSCRVSRKVAAQPLSDIKPAFRAAMVSMLVGLSASAFSSDDVASAPGAGFCVRCMFLLYVLFECQVIKRLEIMFAVVQS